MSRASSPPSPTNSIDDGRPSLSELAPARRAAWLAKLSSTPEYKILSKLSQPSTSVHDVFHEIQELVFAAVSNRGESSNDFSLDLSNVYESLIEIIHVTSRAEQSPFVEFLFLLKTELGDRGDSDVEFDEVEKAWFKEDGPVFGMLVRESHGLNNNGWDPRLSPAEKQEIENIHAFCAQLTKAGVYHFPLFAKWACDAAFVNGPPPHTPQGNMQLSNTCVVRAACQWFIYMADMMWADVQGDIVFPASSGEPQQQWFEYSGWEAWVRGLKDALDGCSGDNDEGTRRLIRDALVQVKRETKFRPKVLS